eukprot:360012-Pleurochrysis_carterae.AAC.1
MSTAGARLPQTSAQLATRKRETNATRKGVTNATRRNKRNSAGGETNATTQERRPSAQANLPHRTNAPAMLTSHRVCTLLTSAEIARACDQRLRPSSRRARSPDAPCADGTAPLPTQNRKHPFFVR